MESWHLPINLSAQIAPDYISEYLNFQNFLGGHVLRPPSMSYFGLSLWAPTRPYCISPQYAPLRLTNKKCLGTPLTSIINKNLFLAVYLLCTIWCSVISTRPVIKGQGLRISPGYYERDLQLCTFMGNKRKKEQKNLLAVQFLPANFIHLTTWNHSDSSVIQLYIKRGWMLTSRTCRCEKPWVIFLLLFPSMVNSLYNGHNGDLELMSSLPSVHNCKSLFQSNICNLFLPGI